MNEISGRRLVGFVLLAIAIVAVTMIVGVALSGPPPTPSG
jgi:hypothetical protein